MILNHTLLLTVVGPLLAAASETGLLRLSFLREAYEYRTTVQALARQLAEEAVADDQTAAAIDIELVENEAAFDRLTVQLGEYFCGKRKKFDIPLDLHGSGFQKAVWRSITKIPYGKLRSFKKIASEIGRPRAVRAVGQAVGKNPVSIVLPCHRVIGSNGHLVGFGAGISIKSQLLRLEGHTLGRSPRITAPRLF